MTLEALKRKALQDPAVRAEYDRLGPEFELIDQLLTMRHHAGLTQDQVAERMGTHKSNISRLERGKSNPSWHLLRKYATVCGYDIHLVASQRPSNDPAAL
ncbi:DNA-binding XRE family transcriptional regulator [Tamilnaduibacter salinus]|uniref:DNA-binding XRE family transcriptional regulator n=1 Tax=Tamilnaduibacter salinus TaxID=1484056 RepID=A0A2U1CU67_9GAMM|nr:helix-turn-helix transcriptional regulator [Tamilnaduibacter salinus]PVY70388.1 DNA-binding XRE family transcriptional regulator [Tamilnaduibacter salinus]